MWYNQIWDIDLKNSCSVLALLDYLKYEYYIEIPRDSILILLDYLKRMEAWFPKWWADAWVVYPAIVKYIKWRYWLSIKIKVGNIEKINDGRGHILGFKWANKKYLSLTSDKEVTSKDIDEMQVSNWHFIYYENNVVADNLWWILIRWTYENIQYAYHKWLFYYNTREFEPADDKTRRVAEYCKRVGKSRRDLWWKNYFLTPQELKKLNML